MQILMEIHQSDGCTYGFDSITPIVAESVEEAYVAWCDARDTAVNGIFKFAEIEFNVGFDSSEPTFITVEQFFKDAYWI